MKQTLVDRLTDQPSALDHLLGNLTEAQLHQRPQPEKWSILENLAHLGRYQTVFLERMQLICAEEGPVFSPYVADSDPGFLEWTRLSASAVTEQMTAGRATLITFLAELQPEQLLRVGQHPVYGPMTITGWTEFFLLHEAHHFFTILKAGSALRTEAQPMGLADHHINTP